MGRGHENTSTIKQNFVYFIRIIRHCQDSTFGRFSHAEIEKCGIILLHKAKSGETQNGVEPSPFRATPPLKEKQHHVHH
jgi:hypothetical protein